MSGEKSVINKIEVQKRNKDRVNVFIDNEYSFSCSSELIYVHGLKAGKPVNIEELREIVNEDNFIKCKNDALKIIEKNYKSEKEVFDKLIKKEYDEKNIARAIEFLKSYNFVNDDYYTSLYVKEKIKSQGKNKIKYALSKKGIDENIIEDKLKQVTSGTEEGAALKLAEKKYKVLSKSETDARKISSKLWDFLLRNGFEKDIIEEALSKTVKIQAVEHKLEKSETNFKEIYELAEKRYKVITKSEDDKLKQYKKLTEFLLRRGHNWEDVKKVVNDILKDVEFYE
jgi:regulatory protein